ncbi:MAG: yqjA [Bacteroidetes bacterium]|jgi:membrane-associated protein|nr:yqjA [Bacteroidota bacterium]
MDSTWQFLKDLVDPESIVRLGLPLLLFVIFAETGLLVGFFLPGDSLVFISGLICATNNDYIGVGIITLILSMSAAAIAGNMTGYWFGRKVGDRLYKRKDSFFFKRRHLDATQAFYEKHGGKTIILGRFLPIIRTFAPILAGVIKIDVKKFLLYNVIGAVAWIGSISSIGYFLGRQYPQTKDYLGWIVIGLIIITTIPVILTYIKEKKKKENK